MKWRQLAKQLSLVVLLIVALVLIDQTPRPDVVTGWTLAILFYFAPWLIAMFRNHHNRSAIAVLNLLLGWTLLGWIIALVWACTATHEDASRSGPVVPGAA